MNLGDLEAALHARADKELDKMLQPLRDLISNDRTKGHTTKPLTAASAPRVTVPEGTWAPAILHLAEMAVKDAVRDEFRKAYVQRWLHDVDRSLEAVQELKNLE